MAKLNVVVPAVEVTVEVNGKAAKYRKVDRKAQAGDIVKALMPAADVYVGSFYEVKDVSGSPAFLDDGNDWRPALLRNNPERFEVYAPIAEPAAEPNASTITFQGAEWRKVDRAAHKGDAIKFTDEDRASYLRDAELYVVTDVDAGDDTLFITDDDGDEIDIDGLDHEVYEKVASEYREVKRKANVGERIKIVNASITGGRYANGFELVVDTVKPNGVRASLLNEAGIVPIFHFEYVVLEPVAGAKTEPSKPERLRVGEYARVVEYDHHAFSYGDIVKIIEDDGSCVPYLAEKLSTGRTAWAEANRFVRATDEEVAAAKDPRNQFAVGDKVRLISGGGELPLLGYENNGIYTVTNPKQEGGRYPTVQITGGGQRYAYAKPEQIVKLTAEEVAEAERKQAEEAKWAAIGRKVNEFKRGDIVEVKHPCGAPLKSGDLVTVKSDSNTGGSVRVTDIGWAVSVRALVVPAEQRFDTEEVDAA